MTQNNSTEAGDQAEVIYEYTDAEAVSDGVLIDITDQELFVPLNKKLIHIDRITGNLKSGRAELSRFTIPELVNLLENSYVAADTSDAGLIKMDVLGTEVWLMPNERQNHYTAMLPDDY